MIKYLIVVLALFLIPSLGYSQSRFDDDIWKVDTSRHIPENSTTIYVSNTTFLQACNAILDAGFTIDKKDNDLQTAQTVFKLEGLATVWNPIIYLRVKDGTAILKSTVCFGEQNCQDSYYHARKGKPMQNALINGFMQAYKIAKMLGGNITYSK